MAKRHHPSQLKDVATSTARSSHPHFILSPMSALVQATVIGVLLTTIPTGDVFAQSTQVSENRRHYAIAPGTLDQVLGRFGQASGVMVAVDPALTAGMNSHGLQGVYSVEAALAALLEVHGLEAVQGSAGGYRLKKIPQQSSEATLPVVTVAAGSDNALMIASEGTHSYAARAATIGKIPQALKDIPQSVTVMTRQRLDDQNLDRLDDVVMKTPGVSRVFLNSGQSSYKVRGFSASRVLTDGVQTTSQFDQILGQALDMAIVDRVEVLRGAAGLQMGLGEPGGVINIVRKRPLAESQVSLLARVGSWGYKRGEIDATGPLNASGSLRGRAVIAYEDRDMFYDRAHTSMPVLYGVLEADIGRDTLLTAGYRHQEYDQGGMYYFSGMPVSTDGSDLNIPRGLAIGPDWSRYRSGNDEVFAEVQHTINDRWKAKVSANVQQGRISEIYLARPSRLVDPATGQQPASNTGSLRADDSQYDFDRKSLDINLAGSAELFGRKQLFVFGAAMMQDFRHDEYTSITYTGQRFNLNDPAQSSLPAPVFGPRAFNGKTETNNHHIYGNTVLHLAEPLKLTLGGRLSWYESTYTSASGIATTTKQSRQFTPFAGLVYALSPEWSAYTSYTDIFQPQNLRKADGSILDPAVGKNYELGIKGELLDQRLNVSAAVFQIEQTGRSAIDPRYTVGSCPGLVGGTCYINEGKIRSRGLELEVNGAITENWQASASYTNTRAIYLEDNDANGNPTAKVGQQYSVIPRHTIRAFTSYTLPGNASAWTIGAGVAAQSETSGADYDGIVRHQGSRAVWDAMVNYRIKNDWTLALNINNLFDKRYFSDEYTYRYGEPRSAMLTMRVKY
jgi:outer membrane receptor for ferric coprogen and ferric-rhodotorulic acid